MPYRYTSRSHFLGKDMSCGLVLNMCIQVGNIVVQLLWPSMKWLDYSLASYFDKSGGRIICLIILAQAHWLHGAICHEVYFILLHNTTVCCCYVCIYIALYCWSMWLQCWNTWDKPCYFTANLRNHCKHWKDAWVWLGNAYQRIILNWQILRDLCRAVVDAWMIFREQCNWVRKHTLLLVNAFPAATPA